MSVTAFSLYSKKAQKCDRFNLFTFFCADLIQSEASSKLTSTSDWLLSAWKNVSRSHFWAPCCNIKPPEEGGNNVSPISEENATISKVQNEAEYTVEPRSSM